MAIILNNNPLPRTGALYVSNPRRKSIKRRTNSPMNRFIYGAVFGKIPSRLTKDQKKKIIDIREGRAGTKNQQQKAKAAYRKYKNGTGTAKTFKSADQAKKRKFIKDTYGKSSRKSSKKSSPAKVKSATWSSMSQAKQKRLTKHARDSKWTLFVAEAGMPMKKASALYKRLKKAKSNPIRRKNVSTKSSGRKIKYKTFNSRLAGCGLTAKQKSELWKKYKSSGKLPALARTKASSVKKSRGRKTTKRKTTRKSTRKKLSAWQKFIKANKGSGKTLKQLSRLYKSKGGAKKASRKPVRRKSAKRHAHKSSGKHAHSHVSAKTRAGVTLRRLGYKGKLTGTAMNTLAKRRAKIKALRAKGATAKAYEGVRRAGGSRKGKTSAWSRFLKKFGGRGLTRVQLKRLYKKPKAQQDLVAQRLKKQRVRKGESKSAARKRYQQRARGMVRQRGKRQPMMGPYLMRLNPSKLKLKITQPFSSAFSLVNKIQDYVAQVPVVGMAAPYIAPLGLGAVTALTSFYATKYIGPEIQKLTSGTMLQGADRYGYFLSGSVLALALAAGHRYLGVFDSRAIQMVSGLAVAGGAFADVLEWKLQGKSFGSFFGLGGFEKKVRGMAGIHMNPGHYGDGGLYYLQGVGQGRSPLSGAHTRNLQRAVPSSPHQSYSGIASSLSGAANASGAPMGYGALMYTGSGY